MTDEARIVVGVDGSAESLEAVRWAAERAGVTGTHLHLVHVAAPVALAPGVPLPGALPNVATMPNPSDMAAQEQADLELLTSAADFARGVHDGVRVSTERLTGGVGHAIVEASHKASVVVLGSSGLPEGLDRLLSGSLVLHVSSHAACPTVVVQATRRRGPVVVGVDGSPPSHHAARFAIAEAARDGVPLVVVHSWSLPVPIGMVEAVAAADLDDRMLREKGATVLADVLDPLRADYPDVEVQTHLSEQDPSQALLAVSVTAGLVVVGSRGHGNLAGLLLGSTSQNVLRLVRCPVAVVR